MSDDASAWTECGQAHVILDNLIAQGKAKPMIVVMPLGYGAPEIVVRGRRGNDPALSIRNYDKFREYVLGELIPLVDKEYRVRTDRLSRAITGLSMGGGESEFIGLNALDRFGWIGAFSAGGNNREYETAFPKLDEKAASQLKLLWIACGTEDRLITANRDLVTWLKGKGIHLTQIETPGMHTWMVWRRDLIEFAPLLFSDSEQRAERTSTARSASR